MLAHRPLVLSTVAVLSHEVVVRVRLFYAEFKSYCRMCRLMASSHRGDIVPGAPNWQRSRQVAGQP